jgi:hypothetical protein
LIGNNPEQTCLLTSRTTYIEPGSGAEFAWRTTSSRQPGSGAPWDTDRERTGTFALSSVPKAGGKDGSADGGFARSSFGTRHCATGFGSALGADLLHCDVGRKGVNVVFTSQQLD